MKRNKERKTRAKDFNFMIAHPLIELGELFTKQRFWFTGKGKEASLVRRLR